MNINGILKGTAVSKIKCAEYFRIKKDDKEIEIEEFIKELKNNNKTKFTHDMIEKQVYLYREKELKYEELFNSKVENLETAKYHRRFYNLFQPDKKIYYLSRLIDTLDRYINKARYELIKSSNIIDIDYLNSDINNHSYDYYYFQRCFNAENAIYSYYSTFEILMQIVWISKDYYSGNNLNEALKSYSLKKLKNKLVKEKECIFLGDFYLIENKKWSLVPKFEKVRLWCNEFKHKGILRFEGEGLNNELRINMFNLDGSNDFNSNDFQYKYIDLDNDVIPELIEYHRAILELSDKIICKVLGTQ